MSALRESVVARVRRAIAATEPRRIGARALDLLALGVTAHVFLVLAKTLTYSSVSYDESYFLWTGFSLKSGLVPYKEFFEYKPPLIFATNAVALLFGLDHQRYRLLFVALALSGVLAFQAALMSRRVGRLLAVAASLAVTGLFLDGFFHDSSLDDAESIGLSYYLLGLALLLAATRFRRTALVLGGVLFSFAALSKEPFVLLVVPSWAAAFLLREDDGTIRRRAMIEYAMLTLAGVAIVLVLLCVWLVPTGGMSGYLALLGSYRTYSDPSTSVCVVLGRWTPGTFQSEWALRWLYMRDAFFRTDKLAVVLPYALPLLPFANRRGWPALFFVIASLLGGIYAVTLTGCFWVHYWVMAIGGIALALFAATRALRDMTRRMPPKVRLLAGCVMLAWVGSKLWTRYEVAAHDTVEPKGAPNDDGLLAFIARTTTPSDRIWTTGNPALYVFSQRLSATRESAILDDYLPQTPGRANEEKLAPVYRELVNNRPKVIYLDPEYEERRQEYLRVVVYPFLEAMHYRLVSTNLYVRPD